MIQFDIIIVSNSSFDGNRIITQNCIDSIKKTEDENYTFNVIVVEQNNDVNHHNAQTIHYDFDFNYNKCLNLGLSHSVKKYKGLCNNDLIFHKGWADGIHKVLSDGIVGSASPYCPKTHGEYIPATNQVLLGYEIKDRLAGWAIFLTDETLSKIGTINENVSFWYSDNIYGEQLKVKGIRHGLVCNAFVTHLGSVTLAQSSPGVHRSLTTGQLNAFKKEQVILKGGKIASLYEINQSRKSTISEKTRIIPQKKIKKEVKPDRNKKVEKRVKPDDQLENKTIKRRSKPDEINMSDSEIQEFVELKMKK